MEGPIELKKSWSEWARPRLQRAWSNNSTKSVSLASLKSLDGRNTPSSPLISPTSAAVGAMERNMEAAMQNINLANNHANIGMAN